MWRDFSILSVVLITVSCATTSYRQSWAPPEESFHAQAKFENLDDEKVQSYFKKFLEQNKEPSAQWWGKYYLALSYKASSLAEESCQIFNELSKIQEFPLKELSKLRSYESCVLDKFDYDELLTVAKDDEKEWFAEVASEVGYQKSKENREYEKQSVFAYELSKHKRLQSEKIKLLKESIKISTSTGDNEALEAATKRLHKVAPRLAPKSVKKELSEFELAFDYRRIQKFEKAEKIYKKVLSNNRSKPSEVFRALEGLRAVAKIRENRKEILEYSSMKERVSRNWFIAAKKNKDGLRYFTNLYHKGAIHYARTLWTYDRRGQAIKVLEQAEKLLDKYRPLDQVYWLHARIEEEKGNFESAVKNSQKALREVKKESPIQEKLLWQIAWNLRKIEKYEESLVYFDKLIEYTENHFLKSKAKYWKARTLQDFGKVAEAKDLYRAVIEEDQVGYYTVLSYRGLGEKLPPLRDLSEGLQENSRSLASDGELDELLVRWLISVGEKNVARTYLLSKRYKVKGTDDEVKLIELLARAGEYNWVFTLLSDREPEDRNALVAKMPSLLFPRPHLDTVLNSSERFGVKPELIYAVMRQESGFNQFARSPADAYGLMQMLPRVARKTASTLGIEVRKNEDLFKPEIIIPLGVKHLNELFDKYNNQFILSVASYNASERAVRGWVRTRFRGDPTEFIEDIPYEETQGYIKLVLRNMVFYQRLLSETPEPFPEWCLTGLQSFKS